MKKTLKTKEKATDASLYTITLTMGDWTTKSNGITAIDALTSLTAPVEIVANGVLTIVKGERSAQLDLTPTRMRRLFYPNAQLYVAEELEYLMK